MSLNLPLKRQEQYFLLYSEAYLEPSRASMMELSWENSQQLKAVSYFRKKSSIVDVRLGSKYTSSINLEIPLLFQSSIIAAFKFNHEL